MQQHLQIEITTIVKSPERKHEVVYKTITFESLQDAYSAVMLLEDKQDFISISNVEVRLHYNFGRRD